MAFDIAVFCYNFLSYRFVKKEELGKLQREAKKKCANFNVGFTS